MVWEINANSHFVLGAEKLELSAPGRKPEIKVWFLQSEYDRRAGSWGGLAPRLEAWNALVPISSQIKKSSHPLSHPYSRYLTQYPQELSRGLCSAADSCKSAFPCWTAATRTSQAPALQGPEDIRMQRVVTAAAYLGCHTAGAQYSTFNTVKKEGG